MEDSRHNSVLNDIETIPHLDFSTSGGAPESQGSVNGWTEYCWVLLENHLFLYRSTLRALLVSTLIAFLIPVKYQSTARIMPPEQTDGGALLSLLASRGSGNSGSSGLGALAGNLLGMKTTGALFVELLRSRTVQSGLVQEFHLQKVYRARYEEDARKALNHNTTIDEDRKSGVISLTLTDSDPRRCHDLAEGYLRHLDSLLSQVSTSSARRERIFIEQRMAAVKIDLEDAEHQFSTFASKNTALDIKEQGKAMVEAAAVLQGQLMAAQSELQGLEAIYTGNNVRVRALKARVGELQHQLQKFGGSDASLDAEGGTASKGIYPSIRELPLLGVQWADLYRRTKIQETVYELLNQQYELTRIQEAREIPTVRVVDAADVPETKSWPPRLIIIAALTFSWFVLAMLWLLASNYWGKVDPHDPRKMLIRGFLSKSSDWKHRHLAWLRFRNSADSIL